MQLQFAFVKFQLYSGSSSPIKKVDEIFPRWKNLKKYFYFTFLLAILEKYWMIADDKTNGIRSLDWRALIILDGRVTWHNLKCPGSWWDSISAWFRCHFLPRCFATVPSIVILTLEATVRFYFIPSSTSKWTIRSKSDLTSCASNWFADHNEWPKSYTIIRLLFEFIGISLDRNYWKVINLLFII